MIAALLMLVGMLLYAVCEGMTEGFTWNVAQDKEGTIHSSGQYHLYRWGEAMGIAGMILGTGLSGFGIWKIFEAWLYLALMETFYYRLAFACERGTPKWKNLTTNIVDVVVFGQRYVMPNPAGGVVVSVTIICALLYTMRIIL